MGCNSLLRSALQVTGKTQFQLKSSLKTSVCSSSNASCGFTSFFCKKIMHLYTRVNGSKARRPFFSTPAMPAMEMDFLTASALLSSTWCATHVEYRLEVPSFPLKYAVVCIKIFFGGFFFACFGGEEVAVDAIDLAKAPKKCPVPTGIFTSYG
jgi:hypothetical protein